MSAALRAASATTAVMAARNNNAGEGEENVESSPKFGGSGAPSYAHWNSKQVYEFYKSHLRRYPEVAKVLKRNGVTGAILRRLEKNDLVSMGLKKIGVVCMTLDLRDQYKPPKNKMRADLQSVAALHRWKMVNEGNDFHLEWYEPELGYRRSPPLAKYDANQDVAVDTKGRVYLVPDRERQRGQTMKELLAHVKKMKTLTWKHEVTDRPPVFFNINITVSSINLQMETFNVDGNVRFYWRDPELLSTGKAVRTNSEGEYLGDTVAIEFTHDDWLPIDASNFFRHVVPNTFNNEMTGQEYNLKTQVVSTSYKFSVEIFEEMELHRFPYDRQFLQVQLLFNFEDWRVISKAPKLWRIPYDYRDGCNVQLAPRMRTQYELFTPWADRIEKKGESFVLIGIRVQRFQSYFATNMIFPLFLITLLSLAAFRISAADIPNRMATIFTLLLTTVAFKFIIAAELPPMSYMTYIDKYLVFIYLWYVAMTGESLLVAEIAEDDEELADSIDRVVFWASASVWCAIHLLLVFFIQYEVLYKTWEEVMRENAEGSLEKIHKHTFLSERKISRIFEEAEEKKKMQLHQMKLEKKQKNKSIFDLNGRISPGGNDTDENPDANDTEDDEIQAGMVQSPRGLLNDMRNSNPLLNNQSSAGVSDDQKKQPQNHHQLLERRGGSPSKEGKDSDHVSEDSDIKDDDESVEDDEDDDYEEDESSDKKKKGKVAGNKGSYSIPHSLPPIRNFPTTIDPVQSARILNSQQHNTWNNGVQPNSPHHLITAHHASYQGGGGGGGQSFINLPNQSMPNQLQQQHASFPINAAEHRNVQQQQNLTTFQQQQQRYYNNNQSPSSYLQYHPTGHTVETTTQNGTSGSSSSVSFRHHQSPTAVRGDTGHQYQYQRQQHQQNMRHHAAATGQLSARGPSVISSQLQQNQQITQRILMNLDGETKEKLSTGNKERAQILSSRSPKKKRSQGVDKKSWPIPETSHSTTSRSKTTKKGSRGKNAVNGQSRRSRKNASG